MGLIQDQPSLTVLNPDLEDKRRRTWPGMAHWAGTGPTGKTCRMCNSWTGCGVESGYYANGGKHKGAVKPRPCEKYQELMAGETGPAIPHETQACKYFSENPLPPAPAFKCD